MAKDLPASKEIPFIDLIKDSWPVFQDNAVLASCAAAFLSYAPMLVVGIPACIIGFLSAGVVAMINKELVGIVIFPEAVIFALAFAAAYNACRSGWTVIILKLVRGEGASFTDLKAGMPYFMNFFLCMLIIGIGTALGSLMLLVPGLFFAVRTAFAPFLIVDEDLGPIEALQKSNELVTGYSWQILAYYLIFFFANLVIGFIPLLPLILTPVAMAFLDLVLARIYLYRKSDPALLR